MPTRFVQLTELLASLAARLFSRGVKSAGCHSRRRTKPPARCWFERLEAREVFNATYHGGALLPHVEAQPVFLGTTWSTNATLISEASSIDSFMPYLVQSPYMDLMTDAGYNVFQGTATAGARVTATLAGTVTDADIRTALQTMISTSLVSQPTQNKLYVIYMPSGVAVNDNGATSITTFLGYHGAFAGRDRAGVPFDIHYVVVPHPGTPNPTSASQGFPGLAEVQTLALGGASGGTLTPALGSALATTAITRTDEVQTLTLGGSASGVVTLSYQGVQASAPLIPKAEVQQLDLAGADGGTVRLSYNGVIGTEATTLTFHPGVSPTAADVSAHLKSIPALADQSGTAVVDVTGSAGGPFTIKFVGALTDLNVNQIAASATAGTSATATTVTDGLVSAADVQAALESIAALSGNVQVTPADSASKFNITFVNHLTGKNIDDTAITAAATTGTTAVIAKTTDGSLPSAAAVQASLNTITGLTNNVTVTGNPGGPFTITVKNNGNIAGLDVSRVTGGMTASIAAVADGGATADLDQMMAVTSHELAEAVTDPDVNYKTLGWYDAANNVEIGDITGASTNTTRLGEHGYLTQNLFDKNHVITPADATATNLTTSPALATPKVLSLTRAEVTWTPVTGATGYRILLVNSNGTTSLLTRVPAVSNGSPVTSAVLTGLHQLFSQTIRVEAYNASEHHTDSADVTFAMPLPALTAPTGVSATKNPASPQTSVILHWAGNGSAAGYRILLINGARRTILATAGETATSATISGLTPGATLKFRVEAFRGSQIADSGIATVTLAKAVLAAPSVTRQALAGGVVQLTWTMPATSLPAQGFRVYRLVAGKRSLVTSLGASAKLAKIAGSPAGSQFQIVAFRGTTTAASKWV